MNVSEGRCLIVTATIDTCFRRCDYRMVLCIYNRCVALVCFLLKNRTCLRNILTNDNRHTGLDDPGFLAGDECQRVAEKLGVIETDIRDD